MGGCSAVAPPPPCSRSIGVKLTSTTHLTFLLLEILNRADVPFLGVTVEAACGAEVPPSFPSVSAVGSEVSVPSPESFPPGRPNKFASTAPNENASSRFEYTEVPGRALNSKDSSSLSQIKCSSNTETLSAQFIPGTQDSPARAYRIPRGWSAGSRFVTSSPRRSETALSSPVGAKLTSNVVFSPGKTVPNPGVTTNAPKRTLALSALGGGAFWVPSSFFSVSPVSLPPRSNRKT
mmetsp:Transcript_5550/g.18289  ORF Transcript_5550/g.18289 Transcript_5550/m.18289 type:complete len:235 (+) Transcript_5550:5805-6509(+)